MPNKGQEALPQNHRWPALSRKGDLNSKYKREHKEEVESNPHRTAWETNNKEY